MRFLEKIFTTIINEETSLYLSFLVVIISLTAFILVVYNLKSSLEEVIIITNLTQLGLVIAICLLESFDYHDLVALLIYIEFQLGITLTLLLLAYERQKKVNVMLFTIILNNLLAFHLSNYSLVECLIQLSIFIFAYFIYVGDKDNDVYNERLVFSIMHQSYVNLIIVGIGFKKNILLLIIMLFIMAFISVFIETKEKFYDREKKLSTERSYKNKLATLFLYFNLIVRKALNYFNKDIASNIIYISLIIIIGNTLIIMGLFGSAYVFAISLATLDFNSRIAAQNWQNNSLYKKRALNNLSDVQFRSMQRVAEAVVEYASSHPAQTITAVTGAIGGAVVLGTAILSNKTTAENTEAVKEQNGKIQEQNDKIQEQNDKIQGQTDQMALSTKNTNQQWAFSEIDKAVSPELKEALKEVVKTGDMVHINKEAVDAEMAARSRNEVTDNVTNNNNAGDSTCSIS